MKSSHAHARQRNQKRRSKGAAATAIRPHPSTPGETATAPLTSKDNMAKLVGEIKSALENDAKNVGIQAARLMLVEDFLRVWADADKKPPAAILSYTA